jgi:hypothetical protein
MRFSFHLTGLPTRPEGDVARLVPGALGSELDHPVMPPRAVSRSTGATTSRRIAHAAGRHRGLDDPESNGGRLVNLGSAGGRGWRSWFWHGVADVGLGLVVERDELDADTEALDGAWSRSTAS